MSIRRQILAGVFAVAAGQSPLWAGTSDQPAPVHVQPAAPASGQPLIVRALDDPACGVHWLLFPAPEQTPGPRRWLPGPAAVNSAHIPRGLQKAGASIELVIRAGDTIRIEEHTAVVDATLEAIALSNATSGVPLRARLRVGERVVRAIALGPGRAQLVQEEKRP